MYTRRDGDLPLKTGVAAECPGGRGGGSEGGARAARRQQRSPARLAGGHVGRGSNGVYAVAVGAGL